MLDEFADSDHDLGGRGQFGAETRVNFLESRNNAHQEENRDDNGHDCNDGGVHQRGFDFFAEPLGVFQVGGQTRKNLRQQTALFAGAHHGNIQPVESLGMAYQRLRKAFARLHS